MIGMIGMIDFLIVSCVSLLAFAAGWISARIGIRTHTLIISTRADRMLNDLVRRSRR